VVAVVVVEAIRLVFVVVAVVVVAAAVKVGKVVTVNVMVVWVVRTSFVRVGGYDEVLMKRMAERLMRE